MKTQSLPGNPLPDLPLRAAFAVALLIALLLPCTAGAQPTLPAGFQESVVFSGLTQPTAVKFASDGRVFVAEKSGLIKVFDSLADPTPEVFADLRTNVHNFWDRGLLGFELHPSFPATPYVYVLYTLDAAIGGTPPRWGTVGGTTDGCPTPPGPTGDGCVVGARLSRLQASGNVMTGTEQVFLEDWCQQYPSHSIGSLFFGADGALYVSGGEGASFNFADWGQDGSPLNPCGDPPTGVGGSQTPPTAEGGALRSQDVETGGDAVTLDGAILRLDPLTGAALPDNPLVGGDPGDDRIIAYGLRNPFRLTVRPGTNEVWVGDVGWSNWEEINRIASPISGVSNFGWPCYEGVGRQGGYDGANLSICESLYGRPGAVTAPYFTYLHSNKVVTGESCGTGSSAIAGLAFYNGGSYPASYDGALFFTDYNRDCIWAMPAGAGGEPDPAARLTFVAGAANPVQLTIGPGGDLFYVDFDGGTIRRIQHFQANQPPTAVAEADVTNGPAPLTVNFTGANSNDPDVGDSLSYAWDLDGDGQYDDSTSVSPQYTYNDPGTYTVRLQVTDGDGATATDTLVISADNTPPTATIAAPPPSTTWTVGQVIAFTGSATDPQQGPLPSSALSWSLILHHCPADCHQHTLQDFPGVSSGSFAAPDHEYPSHLELRLTATDAGGLTDIESVLLHPKTVALSFQSSPSGLQLTVGSSSGTAPFVRTVIVGSNNSLSAPSPQSLGGDQYTFSSWSDGGAQSHNITAPGSPASYLATYQASPLSTVSIGDATVTENNSGTRNAVFPVSLSSARSQTVTVNYGTADGSAVAPGDYTARSGTVTLSPGQTTATITIAVRGDVLDESNEAFFVNLTGPSGATLGDAQGLGTIIDNDPAPSLSVNNITIDEGNSGTRSAVFTVTLSAPSGLTVTVSYSTANGTATAGSDYVAASGSLVFAPGTTTRSVAVTVNGDVTPEVTETFFVDLSNPVDATIADGRGRGRIRNDDGN